MNSYNARLQTFTPAAQSHRSKSSKSNVVPKWPHPSSYVATPASLAEAGFYYDPSSGIDAVACFMCGKQLAEWERQDDPAEVHAGKCPKCPWVMLKCTKDVDESGKYDFPGLEHYIIPDIPFSSIHFSSSRLPTSRAMEKARLATFGPEDDKWWLHDAANTGPSSKMVCFLLCGSVSYTFL